MAKENKTGQNGPVTENVVETTVNAAPAEQTKRKEEKKHEIELQYGQCIIAPVGREEDEILTTIDDWDSLYNAGDNKGRFVLKSEKKKLVVSSGSPVYGIAAGKKGGCRSCGG